MREDERLFLRFVGNLLTNGKHTGVLLLAMARLAANHVELDRLQEAIRTKDALKRAAATGAMVGMIYSRICVDALEAIEAGQWKSQP